MKTSFRFALLLFTLMFAGSLFAQKNYLHRGNGAEPATVDPHFATGTWEDNIIADMFMGLTTEAADGKTLPGLAESWAVSKDGKTYVFTLRKGIKWSDGKPITSADAVFSFRRILKPETAAKYAFILYPIKNAEKVNQGKMPVESIGVKALSPRKLEIQLERNTPYFIEQLTHYTSFPLPKHTIEKFGDNWTKKENIVVSGAFILEDWKVQSFLKVKKNPYFWDAKNVKLDGVIYYPTEDLNAENKRYRAGELDTTNEIPSGQFQKLKKEFGDQLQVAPYLGIYYYSINTTLPKFKDVRVRKALSMAVNREVITEKILGEGQIPAYGFVPPNVNNYVPVSEKPTLDFKGRAYSKNIAEAKKLMEAAGYSKSKPLKLVLKYNTHEAHKKIAIAVSAMWKQIHVQTELFNQEAKVHYAQLKNAEFEVGRAAWIGDYNDPTTFTDLFLENDYNYSRFFNKELITTSNEASKLLDLKKRAKLLAKVEKIVLDNSPVIPFYYYVSKKLISPKVKGWQLNIVDKHRSRWISLSN